MSPFMLHVEETNQKSICPGLQCLKNADAISIVATANIHEIKCFCKRFPFVSVSNKNTMRSASYSDRYILGIYCMQGLQNWGGGGDDNL